jgi:hypothetical protein
MKTSLFEPIIGCKHPIIASGTTPIGSAGRAPDKKIRRWKNILCRLKIMYTLKETLSLYSNKYNLTIASDATSIGSAGRASDDYQLSAIMKE